MSIQQNQKTVFIASPYDDEIEILNKQLNNTYYGYGSLGALKKSNQVTQDNNAASYSQANSVKRAISKSSHFYKNGNWDIVDAYKDKTVDITKIKDTDLPKEMKGMNSKERIRFIEKQMAERIVINKVIQELKVKRREFVEAKKNEMGESTGTLDQAMLQALVEQAKTKNLTFK